MICKQCEHNDHDSCTDIGCDCCYGSFIDDDLTLMDLVPCRICGGRADAFMSLCHFCNESLDIMIDYPQERIE